MGFKEITIGIIMVALFSSSLLTFAGKTAIDNNAQNNLLNDPSLKGINNSLNSQLGNLQSEAQTQRETFEKQEAQGGTSDEGFSLTSIVGNLKSFFSTSISSFNIIFGLISNVLGVSPMVLNVILSSVIVIILLLIWRVIKIGGT